MSEPEIISTAPTPARRPWWKRIMRLFLWLSGIFVFLVLLLVVLTYVYQDEVKGYVITEVNKRVNTTIIVDPKNIDLTIVRTFPDVSVIFKNISALDATTKAKRDTLLTAGKISLGFNIMDLFRQNYSIHNITIEDARLKVWVDEKGRDNYHFLKEEVPDTVNADTSHVDFALDKISLKNVMCSYSDKKAKQEYKADFHELNFSGDFGEDKYDFSTEADFTIANIALGNSSYFQNNKGSLDVVMEMDNLTGKYTLKTGKLKIAELALDVSGNIQESKKNYLLDLAVKGDDIDLPAALSLLPASMQSDVAELESSGEFYVDGTIKGLAGDSMTPDIIAKFGITDGGTIARKNGSAKLTDISLKGIFSNVKGNDGVQINSFRASSAKSKFSGSFLMKNFDHPRYEAKISGHLDIGEVQDVLQIDTIESASGIVDIQFEGSGSPAKGTELTAKDFRKFKTSGTAKLSDARLKMKGSAYAVDSISGDLSFDGNNVSAENFRAHAAQSDIEVDGTVKNLLGYLFTEREVLDISGSLTSRNLDLNPILNTESAAGQPATSDSLYNLSLPDRMHLHLNTSIRHLKFRQFEANDIAGDVVLNNKRLTADPITFKSMDGSISGSGMIDGTRDDSLLITCSADINSVSIYKLFYQMENFGQGKDTTITYNNVRGSLTSHVNFASLWGTDLNVDENKIYSNADITVTNGELVNFKPLEALSRFIKLDDLRDIKFKSLHNTFEIKNREISMPKMDINSSAIDLTMYGTHSFDNIVDYHFIVDLDELRSKKVKAAKPENSEFGQEIDDGGHRTRLFISMKGDIDNPEMKYDKKEAVKTFVQDLKQEGKNLRQMLHDEWGWFKNDKDKKDKKKDDDNSGKFILQQDDSPKPKDKKKDEDLDDGEDY